MLIGKKIQGVVVFASISASKDRSIMPTDNIDELPPPKKANKIFSRNSILHKMRLIVACA